MTRQRASAATCRSISATSTKVDDHRLRHLLSRRAGREILDRAASRASRSRSISPRSSATARRTCRRAALAIVHLAIGRDRRHAGGAALCREQGQKIVAVVNQPESSIAREADVVLPTLAGPEIGVASTKAFTTQLVVLGGARRRAGAGARHDRRGRRGRAGPAALAEVPARASEVLEPRRAHRGDRRRRSPRRATCSISAAAPPIRWRSKAR